MASLTLAEFFSASHLRLIEAAEHAEIPFSDFKSLCDAGQGPVIDTFRAAKYVRLSNLNAWLGSTRRRVA